MANLSNINNKFLVTTGGNVGIGNTSPTLSTLTVGIGSTNSPSQICQFAGSGSGVYSVLSLTNTNGTAADNNGVGLDFHVNAAYSATGRIQLIHPTAQSGTTTNSSMQFLTYGTVSGVTTFSPRMTIDYRGNVGIGTTSPAALLDVSSGTTTDVIRFGADSRWGFSRANSDNRYLSFMRNQNGSGTAVWTVDGDNGNVGIGTTAPNQEGFGAANIALSVKAPTSGGVANLELIGLGNADNDELGYVNFMSQAATDSAAAIVGLRHTSDTSGKLSFRTAGSERMRIDSSGTVEIPGGGSGIAQSIAKLDVRVNGSCIEFGHTNNSDWYFGTVGSYGSAGNPFISFACWNESSANTFTTKGAKANIIKNETDGSLTFNQISSTNSTGQTPTERMRIDQNGDISMTEGLSVQKQFTTGTNQSSGQTYVTIRNYDAALVDAGDIQSVLRMTGRYWSGSTSQLVESQVYSGHEIGNGNGGSFLGFATQSGGSAVVEAMRIGRGGKLHYNCTDDATSSSAGLVFYPSGDNSYIINAVDLTSSWNHLTFINTNGTVGSISTSGSATAFNTSSDYRLKEDLKEFNGLDKVSNIKVYDFKWKVDENRSYGVLAHELAEVLPQAVNGEKDAKEMQGVDYSKIVPLLVKAIQELKAEIELLKSK